ncbi:Coenzyme F420 hydrogenase/dehydrogenase, beta subunit C-terminal domain [Pseudarthrobacter sp. W1I19]|uniref:Coenzyme F420 hydrogenase/dehydrogenase, beta subunit C-terminal domain n=1 Tax=Pseudarthrobacter sp. W1I19 TaxID=3042288 RepID=UPI0027D8D02D|nr:Coenzyme F420 hydrogenase/dehydrogenase, beta subunit C-terminal domain [Pseudarthrobacter sp. W1I19]
MTPDARLGVHSRTFAGRVADEAYLVDSSSGGLASWLVDRLLSEGHADAVIHVGASTGDVDTELFRHRISTSENAADQRKSQYYATTMADALAVVSDTPQRYIVVGVPCFIRAARALCRENPIFQERLTFFVALVCGHYKTHAFADSLAWQLNVHPRDLAAVDFRVKHRDRTANDYDFSARSTLTENTVSAPVRTLVGGNWGHSAFQPEACNFCDDVVGETADVSFGDAWLPEFISYPYGTNVVVSRNRIIDGIFDAGATERAITLLDASADNVAASQAGGFRHRREGLAVRLADDISAGLSVPSKRVSPDKAVEVSPKRANLIRQRRRMAARSHESFLAAVEQDDLSIYLREYRREAARYRRLDIPLPRRVFQNIKGAGRRILDRWNMKRTDRTKQ